MALGIVMPSIHVYLCRGFKDVDGRNESGHRILV